MAATVATVAALSVLTAGPAMAAPDDATTVTFAMDAGTLDIAAAEAAGLGSGDPGTNFSTGGATASEVVLASEVGYWSGPSTATTGTDTFTTGQVNARHSARLIVVSLLGLACLGTVEPIKAVSLRTVILPATRGDPR